MASTWASVRGFVAQSDNSRETQTLAGGGMRDTTEKIRWFQETILPCEPVFRARIRRLLPSAMDLDDIVSEALVRTYETPDWREVRNGLHYLTTVARNILIDQARRDLVVSFDYLADLDTLGRSVSPEPMLDARDELRRVEAAVSSLPPQQRKALLLRRVHGYSLAEISEMMGVAVSTVETHLSRALAMLARVKLEYSDYVKTRPDEAGRPAKQHRRTRGKSRRPS